MTQTCLDPQIFIKKIGDKQDLGKNEKNQICSKLPQMERKLVEIDFCDPSFPPKRLGDKKFGQNEQNQSCSKNCEKIRLRLAII